MKTSNMKIEFPGSGRKEAFRGWAGKIVEWQEKSPPKLAFGVWKAAQSVSCSGFVELRDLERYEIFMFGANSRGMLSRDKFTYFAYAGLTDDGKLRCVKLDREEGNARDLWLNGGLAPAASLVPCAFMELEGLAADGRLVSIMSFIACLNQVFKAYGLEGIHDAKDGRHLEAITKLQARLPLISSSIPELEKFSSRAAEFAGQWQAARGARRNFGMATN
jgi:hypothetical protein